MAAEPDFAPVTLGGRCVRLEPLGRQHLPQLIEAGSDPAIFQFYPVSHAGAAGITAFVDAALADQAHGTACPFAIVALPDGRVIGSTRFGAIERKHRRAEIGWTWLNPAYQRTGVNTEMKYLMLRHAFEALKLMRVEFKTDSLNVKSRTALARIGAVEEGTFRNHMVTASGRIRHSVYFSITDTEWPAVKARLEDFMAHHAGARAA